MKKWFKAGSVSQCGYMDMNYSGVVTSVWKSESGERYIHVKYSDGDEEDLAYLEFLQFMTFPFLEKCNTTPPRAKKSLDFTQPSTSGVLAPSSAGSTSALVSNTPFPFSTAASPVGVNDSVGKQGLEQVYLIKINVWHTL